MGQKVNPIGVRLGFNKGWHAHWFSSKNYVEFLRQDALINEVINKKYQKAGIAKIDIFRNRGELTISIHTSKPGVVIGRSGIGAQELKATLERRLFSGLSKKDKPTLRITIVEVKAPELSAKIVGENIANQIERRISVKRAMKQAIERTMEKKAKGIKVKIAGRLGGAEIARSESSSAGSIPLSTIRSDVSYANIEAMTSYGVVGVKVWIYLGESEEFPIESPSRNNKFL